MRGFITLVCLLSAAAQQIDPKVYAKLFMNNRPLFDLMAKAVAESLPSTKSTYPHSKVLDLGSGPGEPSMTLAALAPNAHVVCTDFQAAMNEKAQARIQGAGLTNVEFSLTSADDLGEWQDDEFDAVMMNLVLMFVPDKGKALKEVARVLKPGGYAYTAVWKTLDMYSATHDAIEQVAGKKMPDFSINPMKLKADNAVEDLAKAAGLQIKREEIITYPFKMGSAKETADAALILAGEVLKTLEEAGDHEAKSRFYKAIERITSERGWNEGGEVSFPENSPQMLVLHKPLQQDEL